MFAVSRRVADPRAHGSEYGTTTGEERDHEVHVAEGTIGKNAILEV